MSNDYLKNVLTDPDAMEVLNPNNESYIKGGQGAAWETNLGLGQLRKWAEAGLSYKQIATNMGVSLTSLVTWRKESPLIERALDIGRQQADIQVANALFQSAVGKTTIERRVETNTSVDGLVSTKEVVTEREHKGETSAQIFWLKNRASDAWRDRTAPSHQTVNISEKNDEIRKYLYLSDDNFLVEETDDVDE